ncbi:MAG: pyridoxamine 5-phosphate oxidase [Roseibacillus sp.]|nr:pyridoxamine 5-phosphate oxidase [Roseibacillus sp.]|tara:strand:- start:2184 stop:2633 length:450 start_codon:yes stop_codon:yes gene_type:complete
MPKPRPDPFDPEELPSLARKVIKEAKFPMLATIDGDQARLRPVSPVRVDGFTIYVANLKAYHKTAQIAANPKVELCYLAPSHDQIRITGTAHSLSEGEQPLIDEIWQENPLLRQYLGSSTNSELIIYRIVPEQVRFMREWALEYSDVPL